MLPCWNRWITQTNTLINTYNPQPFVVDLGYLNADIIYAQLPTPNRVLKMIFVFHIGFSKTPLPILTPLDIHWHDGSFVNANVQTQKN